MGVDGTHSSPLKTLPLPCILAGQFFSHSFLVIPACPAPLLGQDILSFFRATLTLAPTHSPESHFLLTLIASQVPTPDCSVPTLPDPVDPQVWDTSTPVVATHLQPVLVTLKTLRPSLPDPSFPFMKPTIEVLSPIITHLLSQGLLILIDSPCNTPILSVCKPSGAYCLVQDLCFTNEAVIPVHPLVNNLYNLLSNVPPTTSYFTVLYLKDAFFFCPFTP